MEGPWLADTNKSLKGEPLEWNDQQLLLQRFTSSPIFPTGLRSVPLLFIQNGIQAGEAPRLERGLKINSRCLGESQGQLKAFKYHSSGGDKQQLRSMLVETRYVTLANGSQECCWIGTTPSGS